MPLPDPTVRADAVDHYAALLDGGALPSDALCATVVRGVPVDEALVRYDGFADGREAALAVAGETSVTAFPDRLPLVVADHLDGWTVLVEDNGFHGSRPGVLARLSAGTVAASAYWNVDFDSLLSLARDGRVLAATEFTDGRPAGDGGMAPYLDGLDFSDAHRMCAVALAFLERVSGVRLPADWSTRVRPASVVVDPDEFVVDSGWLSLNAPALLAAGRTTSRASAALAATRACAAAGVDDPEVREALAAEVDPERRAALVARAREDYRSALVLRWERCGPIDRSQDADGDLRTPAERGYADRSQEDGLVARAHAVGAVAALHADDPVDALSSAAYNARQADRRGWPALRDDLEAGASHLA
ncbi:MAG: DUF6461 domain-containing protein [Umezawaea sp.]